MNRFTTLLYGIGEAAGYLSVPPSTLTTWVYGYERRVDDVIDLFKAGEPVDTVAEEFGLSRDEVEDAIRVVARAAAA